MSEKTATIVVLSFILTGCASSSKLVKDGQIRDSWDRVSTERALRTRGIGAADYSLKTATQRKATSRNAALAAARYEMLVLIKGANMGGGITVGKAIQQDGDLRERVDRLIRGAEEIKTEWLEDDGCVVTIEIPRKTLKKILKEDRKWEDILYERQVREQATPVYEGRVREVNYGRKKSPVAAGALGLLFPGGGLMYAGHKSMGGTIASITLVLGAMGAENPGLLAGAGALHLAAAYWGVQQVNRSNAAITFIPKRRGGYLSYNRRF